LVSVGLPKFRSPEHEQDILAWAESEGACPKVYEKLDGSLIIRSVHKGKVLWRTRGAFDLGGFGNRIERWLDANPAGELLRDPKWMSDASLWMEWLDPIQRVVVRHLKPDLILIGGVRHDNMVELTDSEINQIVQDLNWQRPREIDYPEGIPVDELSSWVDDSLRGREGIVLVFERGRIRIKTRQYWLLHHQRFTYNPTVILNAYLKTQGGSKKGKARKRKGSAYERVAQRLHLSPTAAPELVAWVQRCLEEIQDLEEAIQEEWDHLYKLGKKGVRNGDDAVQTGVLRGIEKGRRAKSLLQHHRRHAWIQSKNL
jgi:hypothetical protein